MAKVRDMDVLIEGALDAYDVFVKIKEDLNNEDCESHNALIRCKTRFFINGC